MTSLLNNAQLEELFSIDCKVLDLNYEYHDCVGTERWAIITELSEEELWKLYPDIIGRYEPFVLLSPEQGQAIEAFKNNEAKHRMRAIRRNSFFDINDGEFEEHHPEAAVADDSFERIEQEETIAELLSYLETLEEIQKDRIKRYYFYGGSYTDIAIEDGVSRQAVAYSIRNGIENLKKFYF